MEKLTDGPICMGTRYRAQSANTGPVMVEVCSVRSASPMGVTIDGDRNGRRVPGRVDPNEPSALQFVLFQAPRGATALRDELDQAGLFLGWERFPARPLR